ncbi:hypothetical protein HPB48_022040 [Haemaphysalis longicornis]|uniref:Cytochrome P450 n=1 Tax=Haemaphysalis longicornis TaxID=44386 RepID=A0A9J6G2K7_HAELO|nr:hypothetical protein HPB48_022040 [Haemaphysalis longicornis]
MEHNVRNVCCQQGPKCSRVRNFYDKNRCDYYGGADGQSSFGFHFPVTGLPASPDDFSSDLTEVEALSQCVLFFLAGQDTASTASTFATYLLATNPHVQDRLRAEVDECFRKHGSSPSYDEVAKLPYLDCVVNETLRILPPVARLERCPAEDYVLGDTGIKVPSDCAIAVPVYAMHMDPEFFPEPEIFNPDRQVTSPSQLFF